ncbi:MAG: cysteine dioxygenase family protein [Armatimonadota bacterium]|nr:cysteine dioxygenase family protein [Armatimonadota bacterium]MDR7533780.1 cysteine dioxygenase family protein [Armatimonadota bacterium]MDR7535770.1 cysteine dioxygenase family protein [Armatimonadota bacterium]
MCDLGQPHAHGSSHYGFIVDAPEVRALIAEAGRRLRQSIGDDAARVDALRPAFARLLAAEGWLPAFCAQPDAHSRMGGGIGQDALYRALHGSLCLFALVVSPGAATPVHDHLAWGLVGVYRGQQEETFYRRLDNGNVKGRAVLEISRRIVVSTGEFYAIVPPRDDIHYVATLSDRPSISIHLLANDTACVWRHRFDPAAGTVAPFRSGYSNAPCPPEDAAPPPRG